MLNDLERRMAQGLDPIEKEVDAVPEKIDEYINRSSAKKLSEG